MPPRLGRPTTLYIDQEMYRKLGKLTGRPASQEVNDLIRKRVAELERLKRLFGLGFELNLVWEPSPDKSLSGEVKNSSICVYEVDERKAVETLRHEFLDYCVCLAIEPYKEVTNRLIRMMNDEAYKRKERVVEALIKLLDIASGRG
jgi:hypothetical protein